MRFTIITHVQHIKSNQEYFGYAPYIREMNIWLKYVDEVIIVAPIIEKKVGSLDDLYHHKNIKFFQVPNFDVTSIRNILLAIASFPRILIRIFTAMRQADHIHLRCPGNMGLLASLVQIFYPKKIKTAKYAGNWDPKSKQPWSYNLQKWILSNTFLTKNMQVLVYGKWENQSKNIKPFFTATYSQTEVQNSEDTIQKLGFKEEIKFLFVGTLAPGKQPLYALQLVHELVQKGYNATIDFYGEGKQRATLIEYINANNLDSRAILKGNQGKEEIEKAYKKSHFLILSSKSEGWPKVVTEAMFWKCLPIATKISCVPYILDYGQRGVLLQENFENDVAQIINLIEDKNQYEVMTQKAQDWSREYTLEKFEAEIKKLLL